MSVKNMQSILSKNLVMNLLNLLFKKMTFRSAIFRVTGKVILRGGLADGELKFMSKMSGSEYRNC